MLEIKQICLRAGSFEVKQITFSVPAGTCHALVGATGSGKTMVLETIAGLRKIRSGHIYWLGQDITALAPERRKIAYVPQDLALFPHMTVRENIEYGLRRQKNNISDKFAEIDLLARTLGIDSLLQRSIHNLSGGERQRTALARALIPGHKLLLLDEPFSALHEVMRKELWVVLKTLQQQYGITVLIVTHDMEEAFFLADSVTFISRGKVVQSGEKGHVYNAPENLEAARFFGVQNYFAAEVIEVNNGRADVFCPDLGIRLSVKQNNCMKHLRKNAMVTLGIRAESLIVNALSASEENGRQEGPNQVLCKVKYAHQKRCNQVLLLQPVAGMNNNFLLEAVIPSTGDNLLPSLSPGKDIWLSLPSEQFYLFCE